MTRSVDGRVPADSASRRRFLESLGALGVLALAPGCGRTPRRLTVAAGIWQGYEPLFLAKRQGWLNPDLVRLAEVPANASSLRALQSDIADGAALTLDEVLRARGEGIPLGIILVLDVSAGADMVLARPGIDTPGELRRKRIGVAKDTNGALLLAMMLRQAGLTPFDVTTVDVTMADQLTAWERGSVDALVSYGATADRLLAMGAKNLFDSSRIPGVVVDVLAMHEAVLADPDYASALTELISAHFKAVDFLRREPEAAARLMAAHLGLPVTEVTPAYRGLHLPDAAENRRFLGGQRPALLDSASTVARIMLEAGLIEPNYDLAGLVSDRFLPRAAP